MAQFQVDSDEMAAAVASAHAEIDLVTSHSAQLTSVLAALQSVWTGQASTAFQTAVDDWYAVQTQVETAIANLNQALALASDHYSVTEADVLSLFSY